MTNFVIATCRGLFLFGTLLMLSGPVYAGPDCNAYFVYRNDDILRELCARERHSVILNAIKDHNDEIEEQEEDDDK
jgi:hypothetical protein